MNDAEGRKTLLCEMNVTEGIEDGNKNQGAILALNQSFMTNVLVCVFQQKLNLIRSSYIQF